MNRRKNLKKKYIKFSKNEAKFNITQSDKIVIFYKK
jgi:hypothetical protein